MNLENLTTERRNENTMGLDEMGVKEALQKMNQEGQRVTVAVGQGLTTIEPVVEAIVKSFNQGGRLIYMGTGTSSRLGVLDATECIPTFGIEPETVQSLIAGGQKAMTVAVEDAEDSEGLGRQDLIDLKLSVDDIVVGIAASGRTPYVIGGLEYATTVGATTATVARNKNAEISKYAQVPIEVDAGPGSLTGSAHLKSGTVQRSILNISSTISMIGIRKVCNNLMVDVKPTNGELVERSRRIITGATSCSYEVAELKFIEAEENVKLAIVMILTDSTREEATQKLINGDQFIKNVLS